MFPFRCEIDGELWLEEKKGSGKAQSYDKSLYTIKK